jgi:hypothetical protein
MTTSTNKRKRIAGRLAALEAKKLPPPKLDVVWCPPEPLADDEELVVFLEENSPHARLRFLEKRLKQK